MDFLSIDNVMRQAKSMIINPQVATYAGIGITTTMLAYYTLFENDVSSKSVEEPVKEEKEEPVEEPVEEKEEPVEEKEEPVEEKEEELAAPLTGGKRKKKSRMNKKKEKKNKSKRKQSK
jgi:hypothetical protein